MAQLLQVFDQQRSLRRIAVHHHDGEVGGRRDRGTEGRRDRAAVCLSVPLSLCLSVLRVLCPADQFGKPRHIARIHLENVAPILPLGDDAIAQVDQGRGRYADVLAGGEQVEDPTGSALIAGHADIRHQRRHTQQTHQDLNAIVLRKPGTLSRFVMLHGLDTDGGQSPILEQGGSQLIMVGGKLLALAAAQVARMVGIGAVQDRAVSVRIDARQRQPADPGEQTAGKRLGGRDLAGLLGHGLRRHRHRQGTRPEMGVIEFAASPEYAATPARSSRPPFAPSARQGASPPRAPMSPAAAGPSRRCWST